LEPDDLVIARQIRQAMRKFEGQRPNLVGCEVRGGRDKHHFRSTDEGLCRCPNFTERQIGGSWIVFGAVLNFNNDWAFS